MFLVQRCRRSLEVEAPTGSTTELGTAGHVPTTNARDSCWNSPTNEHSSPRVYIQALVLHDPGLGSGPHFKPAVHTAGFLFGGSHWLRRHGPEKRIPVLEKIMFNK